MTHGDKHAESMHPDTSPQSRRVTGVRGARNGAATVLLTASLLVGGWSASAYAGPSDGYFADATTSLRAQNGLHPYLLCADLTAVANNWAEHMAAGSSLSHNPNYSNEVQGWSEVAENVGAGYSPAAVEQGFEQSSSHREHLLSGSFTEVGYGTAVDSHGTVYVDEVFRKPSGAPCTGGSSRPPAQPSPPVAAAPAPGSPPVTPTAPELTATADPAAPLRVALRAAANVHPANGAIAKVFGFWELVHTLPPR